MVYSLLTDFTSYWEERHRPIIIYNIFFVFFMNMNHISFFPPARKHGLINWNTKSVFKSSTIASSQIFSILINTSWPWALFISKELIIFRISLPEIVIESREKAAIRFISKHWAINKGRTLQAKKLIKIVIFFFFFLGFKNLSLSWLERFKKKWFSIVGYFLVYLIHQACNNMQILIPMTLTVIFKKTWISLCPCGAVV